MISSKKTEHLQTGVFRRLVFLHMMQAFVFSITGMVDCAVVGQYFGAEGLAGMKLAMPVFAVLYLLVGSVLSSGFSVQVTQLLAKGKRERANQCFLWVCAAVAGISLLFMLSACLFPDALTKLFAGSARDAEVCRNVRAYLLPVLAGSFPIVIHGVLSAMAALEGAGELMAASTAVVLVSDIAGDFLAVKAGAGIMGIAAASVAAYVLACLVLAWQLVSGKTIFRPARLQRETGILRDVVISGLPMAVKGLCEFLCPMVVNVLMLRFGTIAGLAALSIQDAVHYLPLAFCEGIAAAVLLLTGMYAAEQDGEALRRERKSIRRYSIVYASLWALLLAAAAPLMLKFFTKDAMIQGLSVTALRWYLLGLPFVSMNYAVRAYLQGMDRQREASLFTLCNQLLLPVIFTWLLGRLAGIAGIFAAFAVHEIVLAAGCAAGKFLQRSGAVPVGEEKWGSILGEVRGNLSSGEEVSAASEAVLRLCRDNGIDQKRAFQVGLCLEELGMNSLEHGFGGGARGNLEYRFIITDEWLILRLRDNGRPFDLTERYKLLNPEDPASHIGLRLIFAEAEKVDYSHTFDLNNVCIHVSRGA